MSKHWDPDGDLARAKPARTHKSWPAGATAGLVLVGAACLAAAALAYQLAGPRDVFTP